MLVIIFSGFFGETDGRTGADCVSSEVCIRGCSSRTLDPRLELDPPFLPTPPNRLPRPPLDPDLADSLSPTIFGDVARRVGANASLSLPTGDGLRFCSEGAPRVLACLGASVSSFGEGSVVVQREVEDSTVWEDIKGDEVVRYPICDWCGESEGRIGGLSRNVADQR
jgi:hypothetical protein